MPGSRRISRRASRPPPTTAAGSPPRNGRISSAPRSSVSVRYLYMRSTNEDVPVRNLGYLPAFNPTQPLGDGPVHGSRPGEPHGWRQPVHERPELSPARSARHVHAVVPDRQEQPRAEGRRRLRARRRDVQPARQRLGHDRQHHAERHPGAAHALLHASGPAGRGRAHVFSLRSRRGDHREADHRECGGSAESRRILADRGGQAAAARRPD